MPETKLKTPLPSFYFFLSKESEDFLSKEVHGVQPIQGITHQKDFMPGATFPYQSHPKEKKLCKFFGKIQMHEKARLNIEDLRTNPFQEEGNDVRMTNKWNVFKEFEIQDFIFKNSNSNFEISRFKRKISRFKMKISRFKIYMFKVRILEGLEMFW